MQAQGDQIDTVNAETFNIGGSSASQRVQKYTNLPYSKGKRQLSAWLAAAAKVLGFTVDQYEGGPVVQGSKVMPKIVVVSLAAAGPSTAQTWLSVPVVNGGSTPWQAALPNGKYAILGAWVSNIQDRGVLRFSHADFGAQQPGFDVENVFDADLGGLAGAGACVIQQNDSLDNEQGYQFVAIGKDIGKPCCPVFTVNNAGTGLIAQYISNTAENPVITLNLAKVA